MKQIYISTLVLFLFYHTVVLGETFLSLNNSGWIHWSQLKKVNSIIPLENKILFKKPSVFSEPLAKIKKGRVLVLDKCDGIWCKVKSEKFKGWIKTNDIWGSTN